MKFTLSWLKEYLDTDEPLEKIADKLTMIGLEVEHIDDKAISSWCDDHDHILKALMRKDPQAAKLAMWQHLENTRQMLFQATIFDDEMEDDRYLFSENPVVHLTQPSTANG